MTTPAKPVRAWAVKRPDGVILANTADDDRIYPADHFIFGEQTHYATWEQAKRDGYRVVRVEVREVER